MIKAQIYILIFISICLFAGYLSADEKRDTTVYTSPQLSVMADKVIPEKDLLFSSYSRITKSDINLINPRLITDVLSGETGLFIKDYGGMGGLKTISIRGTNSQQTLVMIEGMKLSSAQNNIFDLSILPASVVENIDIVRGGASGIFGANSIGGAVNLNIDCDPHQTLKARVSYGSFGEFGLNISEAVHFTNTALVVDYDHLYSKGDYSFTSNQYGEDKLFNRTNGDIRTDNVILRYFNESGDWNFKAISMYGETERGLPGAVIQGYITDSKARLTDNNFNLLLKANCEIGDNKLLSFGLLTALTTQQYYDPTSVFALKGDTSLNYKNNSIQFILNYSEQLQNMHWGINFEAGYADLKGDMLQPEVGRFVKRDNFAVSLRTGYDALTTNEFYLKTLAVIRADFYSGLTPNYSPMMNILIGSERIPVQLKAQVSGNFRIPSFNEMYYLNYGTSNLRPEKSISYNLSLEYFPINKTKFVFSAYTINTKDMIVSMPISPILMSARNMAKVLNRGFEFSANTQIIDELFSLNINYVLQFTSDNDLTSASFGKQLPYVPKEMLNMNALISKYDFTFRINESYTGFTFALPGESYYSLIHSYWLTNVSLSRKISLNGMVFNLRIEAINLFNKQYNVILNYPMAGRQLRATLNFAL